MDKPLKIEKVKIVEVVRLGEQVLITFSDGRITTLESDDLHDESHEPPPDPDKA